MGGLCTPDSGCEEYIVSVNIETKLVKNVIEKYINALKQYSDYPNIWPNSDSDRH